jgi:hypothetical protein
MANIKIGDSVTYLRPTNKNFEGAGDMKGVMYPVNEQTYTIRDIISEKVDNTVVYGIVLNEIHNEPIHTEVYGQREPYFNLDNFKINIPENRDRKLKQLING